MWRGIFAENVRNYSYSSEGQYTAFIEYFLWHVPLGRPKCDEWTQSPKSGKRQADTNTETDPMSAIKWW